MDLASVDKASAKFGLILSVVVNNDVKCNII